MSNIKPHGMAATRQKPVIGMTRGTPESSPLSTGPVDILLHLLVDLAQEVANILWALAKFNHPPPADVIAGLLSQVGGRDAEPDTFYVHA